MGLRSLVFLKGPTMRFGQPTLAVGSLLSPLREREAQCQLCSMIWQNRNANIRTSVRHLHRGPLVHVSKDRGKTKRHHFLMFYFYTLPRRHSQPKPTTPPLPRQLQVTKSQFQILKSHANNKYYKFLSLLIGTIRNK